MRAVVDNNLLISGLLWGDKPGRMLAAMADGHIQVLLSEPLLAELREVLNREKFAARLALKSLTPDTALAAVQASARTIPVPTIPRPGSLRDPDDVHVLACAVAGAADAIVTGDKDLLALGSFAGIPLITVAEALKRLGLA